MNRANLGIGGILRTRNTDATEAVRSFCGERR
jgi:hypothetical protein